MDWLIVNIVIFLAFAFYIFKISYFYDYRYIGNVIRFIAVYYILMNIVGYVFNSYSVDNEGDLIKFSATMIIICLILSILFRSFLVNKFGKEERFSNSEEIDEIDDLKE